MQDASCGGLSLFRIPGKKRKVENERQPVAVDKKKECQNAMDSRFGDDISVEAVAEVDRVDVVTK